MDKNMDESIKVTVTAKVRLYPTPEQVGQFKAVTEEYRRVCNLVSQWYFDKRFEVNQKKFQKQMYHELRSQSGLNSLMVQSTYRTVDARYQTVKTQLAQKPYRYDTGKKDPKTGKSIWKPIKRDLDWLWKPIFFKRPQADYVRNLNYSFVQHGTKISMNVLGERIKVKYNDQYTQKWFNQKAHLGTAKLIELKGHWFLHIPVTLNIKNWTAEQNQHVVGLDRGLRFLATAYDEQGKTTFFSGKQVIRKRRKFKKLRTQLQSKGTKSARRRLKKIGQRENRWMSDVNHCLSKTLVKQYGKNTLFVIENLVNVRQAAEKVAKNRRYEQVSWAFYQLEQFLTYKAHLNNSEVIQVSAKYTSQRCPKCGQIKKSNRNHQTHLYVCDKCGYSSNDDRIGAMNIQLLGTRYISGNNHPKFKKITTGE